MALGPVGTVYLMPTFADLHATIAAVLAEGRIGTPVFVRYFVKCPAGSDPTEALASLALLAADWLRQQIIKVYVVGSAGHPFSLTLQMAGGASALLACIGSAEYSSADVLILGQRGSLAQERGQLDGSLGDSVTAERGRILSAILDSLRTGQPVEFRLESRP